MNALHSLLTVRGVGEGEEAAPVSISGTVTSSDGVPIRNAVVTLSGGNLQTPVAVVTCSLGTYTFTGV